MNNHQQQQFQQNMQTGSGLTRYRSAPSSYFSSFLDGIPTSDGAGFGEDDFEQLFNPRASSPETQRIFSRFMNSTGQENCSSNMAPLTSQSQLNSQFLPPTKTEPDIQQPQQQLQRQQSNDYSSASPMVHQSQVSAEKSDNKLWGSFNSNRGPHVKMAGGGNSGLIRHSSSPAGLFANINIENEFGVMRDIESFGGRNNANAEASFSASASKFKGQTDDGQFGEDCSNDASYIPGFPVNPWVDPALPSDNFLKELEDNDRKRFSNADASDDQNNEGGSRLPTMLSHHLSLPNSSAGLSSMEKMLQDSVPCKIRAKRGCATHPRSIAERVRRTKISERIKKLQELVPNMEKQTNTSDMLDLAVDYIKDLQRQVKTLSDNRARCSCSANQGS